MSHVTAFSFDMLSLSGWVGSAAVPLENQTFFCNMHDLDWKYTVTILLHRQSLGSNGVKTSVSFFFHAQREFQRKTGQHND